MRDFRNYRAGYSFIQLHADAALQQKLCFFPKSPPQRRWNLIIPSSCQRLTHTLRNPPLLGDLIDEKPEFEVEGSGITDSGHIHETKDSDFVDLIREVNKKEAE